MATGTPFVPATLATTVVNPQTASLFRRTPYISASEYRFAPTAVDTKKLVSGSTKQDADSIASLVAVINRASSWADMFCFHRADGTLAASPTTESMWVTAKPDSSVRLICNYKPVLELTGLAMGTSPSQLANIDANTAADTWIDGKTIVVPGSWSVGPTLTFPRPVGPFGRVLAVWTYISGFPHTSLATNAAVGATSIAVGTTPYGVYAGTQLTVNDGASTEVVTVSAAPTGTTINLAAPLQYAHTVPLAPDLLRVTALPWAVEQAVIALTSCLIKTQGSRAMVMPATPGGVPTHQALAEAGALEDFEIAADLLEPFVVAVMH